MIIQQGEPGLMPLHEYTCRSCGHFFEMLVRHDTVAACPACKTQDLERALSLFAVDSDGTRKANLDAGRRHNRKEQVDKAVADREMIEHHHH
jgi:putative FmdB family regulatory protein